MLTCSRICLAIFVELFLEVCLLDGVGSSGGEDIVVDKDLLLLTSLCSSHTGTRSGGSQTSLSLQASDGNTATCYVCTSVAVVLGSHAVDAALAQCIEDAAEPLRRACSRVDIRYKVPNPP